MALVFHKRAANSDHGPHLAATDGEWPEQRCYVVERAAREWRINVYRHVPGRGMVFTRGDYARTQREAKAKCEEIARPAPVDRTASSYTDA